MIPVIQTHLSHRFCLTVDVLGLRGNGSSSQVINQGQDFPEQLPRHRHLGQLKRDIATMADDLGADLDQLISQRGQRPAPVPFGQGQVRSGSQAEVANHNSDVR